MKRRLMLVVGLTAALVSLLAVASSARASIDATTGQIQLIAPPAGVLFPPTPGDPTCPVAGECLSSDTTMFAFDEQQCVPAPSDLPVDITVPGTYDSTSSLTPGTIAAGTMVSSQFVQSESVSNQDGAVVLDGTVHTDAPILGIAVLFHSLNKTDVLGSSGTAYPTGVTGRGLELDTQSDFVVEVTDQHTVEIHSHERLHADQVRIITSCAPATIIVRKLTVPSGAPTQFTFTGNAAGTIGDGGSITVGNLNPGSYTSTEQVPAGWTLTSISCDDPNSSGSVSTATATFNVAAGQTVTCTFTDTTTEKIGGQGLTPGYWKQPQHAAAWTIYKPSDTFDGVFNVSAFPSSLTLLQALGQGGGGVNALGRQAVAALLNATSPSIDYPLYSWQVIQLVHDAIVSGSAGTIESLKNQLEADNTLSG